MARYDFDELCVVFRFVFQFNKLAVNIPSKSCNFCNNFDSLSNIYSRKMGNCFGCCGDSSDDERTPIDQVSTVCQYNTK